jgi:hypothetical protein
MCGGGQSMSGNGQTAAASLPETIMEETAI